jgi:hypothetical protein
MHFAPVCEPGARSAATPLSVGAANRRAWPVRLPPLRHGSRLGACHPPGNSPSAPHRRLFPPRRRSWSLYQGPAPKLLPMSSRKKPARSSLNPARLGAAKTPFGHERVPEDHGFVAIDFQDGDGRTADGGPANEEGSVVTHRPAARLRTCSARSAAMPSVNRPLFLERTARLGVHQVE